MVLKNQKTFLRERDNVDVNHNKTYTLTKADMNIIKLIEQIQNDLKFKTNLMQKIDLETFEES